MNDLSSLLKRLQSLDRHRLDPIYVRHGLTSADGVDALAREICMAGSNTFASVFRGWEPVSYREVVVDVAEKLDVVVREADSLEAIEHKLLAKVAEKYWSTLTEDERRDINARLGALQNELNFDAIRLILESGGVIAGVILRRAITVAMTEVIAKVLLRFAAGQAAKRAAAIAGAVVPGLNVLLGAWTVVDLAGPALRKTMPTVIELALLRLELGES